MSGLRAASDPFLQALMVVCALTPAAIWHWMTIPGQHHTGTFFGSRVQPGFPASRMGKAILRQFRWRIWTWSAGVAAVFVLMQNFSADGILPHSTVVLEQILSVFVCTVAFGLAHNRTQREAMTIAEPAVRMASLAAGEENTAWLDVLDWLVMIVPPLIPMATLALVILHWNQFPSGFNSAPHAAEYAGFCLSLGLFCSGTCWALRYRTRSADWASTPGASHLYRTYIGTIQASVLTLMACNLCAMTLMPLRNTVPRLHFLDRTADERIFIYELVIVSALGLGLQYWMSKRSDRKSSDVMADRYWKWGYFYYNPDDPVLMAPTRNGVRFSLNYARTSIQLVCMAYLLLIGVFFVRLSYEGRALDRENRRIELQIQHEADCCVSSPSGGR